jgi:hypothetical protein
MAFIAAVDVASKTMIRHPPSPHPQIRLPPNPHLQSLPVVTIVQKMFGENVRGEQKDALPLTNPHVQAEDAGVTVTIAVMEKRMTVAEEDHHQQATHHHPAPPAAAWTPHVRPILLNQAQLIRIMYCPGRMFL